MMNEAFLNHILLKENHLIKSNSTHFKWMLIKLTVNDYSYYKNKYQSHIIYFIQLVTSAVETIN